MTDTEKSETTQDEVGTLIAEGRQVASVAQSLAVFYAANQRAPHVPVLPPAVTFSTSANS